MLPAPRHRKDARHERSGRTRQIKKTIDGNDVVLFMKGTAKFPQCGFSAQVAKILDHLGVPYKDVNVLEDQGLREGIKSFTQLADDPAALRQGRVRRRLRYRARDVPGRRAARADPREGHPARGAWVAWLSPSPAFSDRERERLAASVLPFRPSDILHGVAQCSGRGHGRRGPGQRAEHMRLGGRRFLLSLAIIGAAVCLALGLSLPIIRLTKYVFWSTEHSLLSTVMVLIHDGQIVPRRHRAHLLDRAADPEAALSAARLDAARGRARRATTGASGRSNGSANGRCTTCSCWR